jgi:hypothetical protein
MDTERFFRFFRTVSVAPSRRGINRALAGPAAGSVLAPLVGFGRVEGTSPSQLSRESDPPSARLRKGADL